MPKDGDKKVRCSFCGKPQNMAERLIAGNDAYICDECVRVCADIVGVDFYEEEAERKTAAAMTLLEPLMTIVIGLIVVFIVASIIIPMFDMYSLIA